MRRRQIQRIVGLTALLCTAGATAADAQNRSDEGPVVTFTLTDVTRLESWSYFEPVVLAADPTYTLVGNRAMLAVASESRHLDLYGAFQYAQLLGVPQQATFLSPLGPGSTYFDAARAPRMYQLYIRAMSMRVKSAFGLSIEGGRMDYLSAAEGPPRATAVDRLTRERLAGRLIGNADWTPFERAFDGVRIDMTRTRWRATSALVFPTQGAFEESANPTIGDVRVTTGSLAVRWPARDAPAGESARSSELQIFTAHYRDRRAVLARPDNTGRGGRTNVSIGTIGASHVSVMPWRAGGIDTVVWAARQFGDWYGSDHAAYSAIAEAGYQWRGGWQPRVRAGYLYASGDDDRLDAKHGTFFPMLPTTPPALLSGTFAQMNLRQTFLEGRVTPIARLTLSAAVTRMSVARATDRWYSGTGATQIRGTYLGFVAQPVFATGLGTLFQTAAELPVRPWWRVKAEFGVMRGGDAIRTRFLSEHLVVFTAESRLSLP